LKKVKKEIIEIWNIMPYRYQGMMFAVALVLYSNLVTSLIKLIQNQLLNLVFTLLYVAWLFYAVMSNTKWLSEYGNLEY